MKNQLFLAAVIAAALILQSCEKDELLIHTPSVGSVVDDQAVPSALQVEPTIEDVPSVTPQKSASTPEVQFSLFACAAAGADLANVSVKINGMETVHPCGYALGAELKGIYTFTVADITTDNVIVSLQYSSVGERRFSFILSDYRKALMDMGNSVAILADLTEGRVSLTRNDSGNL